MAGKNIFNSILLKDRGYNRFDLSNDHKLSLQMGKLYPVFWDEAVPGDKWNISSQMLLKFFPMIAPVMHRFNAYIHYFYVPMRILWPNFETYYTRGGSQPVDAQGPLPAFPFITTTPDTTAIGSLGDYLGLPPMPNSDNAKKVSAMPFAAFQRIWTEYYMNENLIDFRPSNFELVDGENAGNTDLFDMRFRAWMHDYFTSALPQPQRGQSVDIPLGDVVLNPDTTNSPLIRNADDHTIDTGANDDLGVQGTTGNLIDHLATPTRNKVIDPNGTLEVGATTVTELRRAYALQRFLEKLNIGGGRFKEFIKVMFNVNTGDARVDRPEFLCGIRQNVVIGEVLNTTGTADAPQGNMSGHGIAVQKGGSCNYFVKEPGIIMGIMSVMPMTAYQQGIARKWNKIDDPTEFFHSEFEHIGEQEILNKEIYAYQGGTQDDQTFGYIPRYAEYKYANSEVHGQMRSTLNFWHAGRIFDTAPALNNLFNDCNATTRIFAVDDPDQDNLVAHILHQISVARKMSKYSTPI